MNVAEIVTRFLIRRRGWLLLLAGVAAIAAYFPASSLSLDRSIETMFAKNDPLLPPYRRLKRTFGGNDVVLCVYDDPDLLREDEIGIKRLERIGKQLLEIPGVGGILTLQLLLGDRIVDPDSSVSEDMRNLFVGYTHGADSRTTSIACMLLPADETGVSRQDTVDLLRAEMKRLPDGLEPGIIAGEPVMMVDAFRFIERDGKRLVTATTLLLALIILVSFRSLRWVAIPILVVQLALLLTRGILAISGVQLTMVSSMLTAVVTVIGVATVIHVIVRFREGRTSGMSPMAALIRSGRLLAGPIFWACVTDAVGFGALMAAGVAPVRDFGLMMALGALMVFVSAGLLIPGLALLGKDWASPRQLWGERFIDTQLQRFVSTAQDRPYLVGASLVGIFVFALMGIAQLEIETDFTRNFRSHTSIVRSYELVESKLGGAGVCDIILPAPDRLNWSYMQGVRRLQNRLQTEVLVENEQQSTEPGLTKVISLADAVICASPLELDRMSRRRREWFLRTGLKVMHDRIPSFYDALYGEDPDHPGRYSYRIMLRAKERQPAEQKLSIIHQVEAICEEVELPGAGPQVTGYFVLLTNLVAGMLRDQWLTFAIALAGIGLTMVVALRSIRLALIALVPNAVPILMVNGLMGWLGLKVNMGAAMIAAVSVGLSIDSSIHYLTAYRRSRAKGHSLRESLEQIQRTVGRALVFSTLALIVGFSVLAISEFIPTVYFGVLISLAMLGGLVGNLLWLPMLIRLTETVDVPARDVTVDVV